MDAKLVEPDEKEHENWLTGAYGTVNVCGMEYDAGHALRELDPIAFRCSMLEMIDQWQCSQCGHKFEDQDEADECCEETQT